MLTAFARKPIENESTSGGLARVLRTRDLVALSIGAVIGAGIFSSIGTAAAGEVVHGLTVRAGAGPALVISFLLLGAVCGLCALCYAELASMIPQAGSAYAYAYATLGELVAWIIGWDLILEYAVGNVAVAIAWSGYFSSFLTVFGITIPGWLTHGYYDVMASNVPAIQALADSAPNLFGIPFLINLPAFLVVMGVTVLLMIGVKESTRFNNAMVLLKILVIAVFLFVGFQHIDMSLYQPFAPNGWRGIHQGAAVVFFAYIGFDAVSTAAEETIEPQKTMPRGILIGLLICTVLYVLVGFVLTGLAPWRELAVSDPLSYALSRANLPTVSWFVALGASLSMAAVLLVFQYGQPRILYAMARDGLLPKAAAHVHPKYQTPWTMTWLTGLLVALASLVADDDATYDLTNIGTLFAFLLVCIGVMVLRVREPNRPRPFKVPAIWLVAPLGCAACLYTMAGLPPVAWTRFGIWLLLGLGAYFAYGAKHSKLALAAGKEASRE